MFGYVQIRKPELKIKDYEVYHGFYCGLCSVLKEQYGFLGEFTLTYDMTFLVILLSSVYDLPVQKRKERCLIHPAKKHLKLINEATEYVAHFNILLAYYHFLDDKEDEGSKKAWAGSKLYRRSYKKAVRKYRGKAKVLEHYLKRLSILEKRKETNIYELADCFGQLMKVLFSWRKDALTDYFMELGYYLGRFIYIMDAFDDLKEDLEKGRFNPFEKIYQKKGFDKQVEEMLMDEIAAAAAAYRKLPCIAYRDILGNIVYAGVWNRFDQMRKEKYKNERSI